MNRFSKFGQRFTDKSCISELMQDLGKAVNSHDPEICMLGGGNPAVIPEVSAVFAQELQALLDDGTFSHTLGYYSTPQGDKNFIDVIVNFLNRRYHWGISNKNIMLTNGSQNSFFYLFNLFAGDMPDGQHKKILFPLSPEYVGYMDLGLSADMFTSNKPNIDELEQQQFKYRINFDQLNISDDIAAICVSRPTNPTGNVISDEELLQLDALAQQHRIPLIVDNAYGFPFPGAIYTEARPHWHDNIILGMSLSKFGLPGVRTGIVVANTDIIHAMSSINGITCLAPNNLGARMVTGLFANQNKVIDLRDNVIRPFYRAKMEKALQLAQHIFADLPVRIHKPEGAFFLWLWCQNLPITSRQLYQHLKNHKVYVIPGEDFFVDIDKDWTHQQECLRINYALNDEQLERGLALIATELKTLY